jgi:uncharacterized protein (DUF433 family)
MEDEMDWRDRISFNPRICQGRACVKGTRVMASVILDNLAEGETFESIIEGYGVAREDIRAVIAFAADLVEDRHVPLEQGVV